MTRGTVTKRRRREQEADLEYRTGALADAALIASALGDDTEPFVRQLAALGGGRTPLVVAIATWATALSTFLSERASPVGAVAHIQGSSFPENEGDAQSVADVVGAAIDGDVVRACRLCVAMGQRQFGVVVRSVLRLVGDEFAIAIDRQEQS